VVPWRARRRTTIAAVHYAPHNASTTAVTAGGDCKLTLEDCVIDGPRSMTILNAASVTLRRCIVKGEVHLVGGVTLHLYDTDLPTAPNITGKGKVVRH
jgi:hypothetical protein